MVGTVVAKELRKSFGYAAPRLFVLLVVLLVAGLYRQISAATIPHGTVDLVAESRWITPGHTFYLGLHFQLEKGWHIYWMNPGDSGEPPRVTWHLPPGITAQELAWPAPRRLGTSTIVDFGYDGAVMLLVPMRASASVTNDSSAQLGAALNVLVCREICIPGKTQVSLTLPIESKPPQVAPGNRELFATARKSLPRVAPDLWKFTATDTKDSFLLIAHLGHPVKQATFFPLEESQVDNSASQKLIPRAEGFELTLRKSDELLKPIHNLKGVLELPGDEAYVIDATVRTARASNSDDRP
jgi:DsbC/DsbD-like thiol-disulfide interchange protein